MLPWQLVFLSISILDYAHEYCRFRIAFADATFNINRRHFLQPPRRCCLGRPPSLSAGAFGSLNGKSGGWGHWRRLVWSQRPMALNPGGTRFHRPDACNACQWSGDPTAQCQASSWHLLVTKRAVSCALLPRLAILYRIVQHFYRIRRCETSIAHLD